MSIKTLIGLGFVVAITGCGSESLNDLSELTIEGIVTDDASARLKGVQVRAYCGTQSKETFTNDDGSYELEADVVDCTPLAVEFSKEAYMPAARTLPLPPPTSPVTIDVTMPELNELLCDESQCIEEQGTFSTFDSDPVFHGWVTSMMGQQSLKFMGGEFRDVDGDIVWAVGFGYFDFRDRSGARLDQFQAYSQCSKMPLEVLDWLVDVVPGNRAIDLNLFHLKSTAGRWTERDAFAVVKASFTYDMFGHPIIVDAFEDQLDSIRSNQLRDEMGRRGEFWACMPIDGSGWYMWGSSLGQKGCFSLTASSNCSATSSANTFFTLEGKDLGFLARTWTNHEGKACLEVAMSEPIGTDLDLDLLGGETFFLDGEARTAQGSKMMPSLESPRQPGSCDQPSSCTPLAAEFQMVCDQQPTGPR